jgi:hypothetical protein
VVAYPRPYKENALSTDWYTKLVLTVLAVCAALIAAHDLRGDRSPVAGEGRYRLQVFPMGRMMLKIDSETGQTWRAFFPEPKVWMPIADEPVDTLDDAPREAPEDPDAEEPDAEAPESPPAP